MNNKTVCYNCNRRQIGCHANCEEYLTEKEAIKNVKKEHEADCFLKEQVINRRNQIIKQKQQRKNFIKKAKS